MRQAFGVSRLQNQPSGLKNDQSSMKKPLEENTCKSEIRRRKLDKIYEEEEPHQLFGHSSQLEDFEFLSLYESTKQLVALNIFPIAEPEEVSADLIIRYGLVDPPRADIMDEVSHMTLGPIIEEPQFLMDYD